MADIGRAGIAAGLRKALDLTGSFAPSIGEGIVPTLQLGDLEKSPFSISTPFTRRIAVGAFAAEYSYIEALLGGARVNALVTIDRIYIRSGSVQISPLARASMPTLTGSVTYPALSAKQIDPVRVQLAEAEFRGGTSTLPPANDSYNVDGPTTVEGPFHFNDFGGYVITTTATLTALDCSFYGRLHLVASK